MTSEEIQRRRRERAVRGAGYDLCTYPAVPAEDETEETLSAEPPHKEVRRKKNDEE